MGLGNVLDIAASGLRATNASLETVAHNVANAQTAGYTRKSSNQQANYSGNMVFGVRQLQVTRMVDSYLQSQLRVEISNSGNVDIRDVFMQRIDQMFGVPGEVNALDTIVNEFSQSLQSLATSPESFAARQSVLSSAQILAQQLNHLSEGIQSLRTEAENAIGDAIYEANDALQQLVSINQELMRFSALNQPPGDLLDRRDMYVDRLAELMDVRVTEGAGGVVSLTTDKGVSLLQGTAVELQFDHHGQLGPANLYDADSSKRGVGTITIQSGAGSSFDLLRDGSISRGRIGGLVALRDQMLVDAQNQIDELAHGLALSMSNRDVAGTDVTAGPQTGFDLDVTGLMAGNPITLTYTETPPGTPSTVTFIRVDDPTQLPLSDNATPRTDDTVHGIDFSGGTAAAAAAINAILGAAVSVSNPAGDVLRFLDDGAAGTSDIDAVSASITSSSTQDDGLGLPLFVDAFGAAIPYSDSLDGGPQQRGFSQRIAVNDEIIQNSELLVRYSTSPLTDIGDPARPSELLSRLTVSSFDFAPLSGTGAAAGAFKGTVVQFAQRITSFQSGAASQVSREKNSQNIVISMLQERFDDQTGVDIDQEMTDLVSLQNIYAANTQVIRAFEEMMQMLLSVMR